jgi:hypothetical protein
MNEPSKTENGVKSYPQLDCIELERFIFPVLHVTLGLANHLLKDTVDYADLVVEKTPQVLKDASWYKQIEAAAHKHEHMKQEIVDWGILNGPTLANKHLAQVSGESNKDIAVVLHDIIKLSKKVKSVDILQVVNYNDATTSIVEVPCSAKQSGFKHFS